MDLVIVRSELTMCILLLHYIFCSRFYLLYSECANIQNVEKHLNLKQRSHFARSYTVMKNLSYVMCKAK